MGVSRYRITLATQMIIHANVSIKKMKRNILLVIIWIFFFASCKQDKSVHDFNKIELTVCYWRYGKNYKDNHELKGILYAIIDSLGECKLIDKYSGITRYKVFQMPDILMERLTDSVSILKEDIDIHPSYDKPIIYDGPDIRVAYYAKGVLRVVDFIDDYEYSEHNCLALYKYIDNINKKPIFDKLTDTLGLESLCMQQLVMIYDKFYIAIKQHDSTVKVIKPRQIK
jgi:hypothetical protein